VTVVGTSANKLVGSAYRKLMPHPSQGYSACVIDLIGNQPILCQRRTWRVSSYLWIRVFTLQCILTQTNEQGCFRPLIFSQRYNSLSYVMLRSRLFSLTGEYHDDSLPPAAVSHGSHLLAYWLSTAVFVCRSNLQSNQTVPLVSRLLNVVENNALGRSYLLSIWHHCCIIK